MKKVLAAFLALTLLISFVPTECFESGILGGMVIGAEATTYGDYEYSSLTDGTIEITGYTGTDSSVSIPASIGGVSVTSIGYQAFSGCTSITAITIPSSINSVYNSVFKDCTSLASITVNSGNVNFVSVNGVLFSADKTVLCCYPRAKTGTSYTVPSTVTKIDYGAFYGCGSLTSITLQSGILSIGGAAFDSCTALSSITIPETVTSIGYFTFARCSALNTVTFSDGVSIKKIPQYSFLDCTALKSIIIPNGVTTIETYAFDNCKNLQSVIISSTVSAIGDNTFCGCSSLETIVVYLDNNYFSASYGILYNKDKTKVVCFPKASAVTDYTVPSTVKEIGNYALCDCTALKKVTIPDSVTTMGSHVFDGCTNLESVALSTNTTSIGSYSFRNCTNLKTIEIPNGALSIGTYAFYNCQNITSMTIPNSVTQIGTYALDACANLSSLTLSAKLETIPDYMVYNCPKLTAVTVPDSVTEIGQYAFAFCTNLTSVTIPSSVTDINNYAFGSNFKGTIYGKTGSYAETYAQSKTINFVDPDLILLSKLTYYSTPNQAYTGSARTPDVTIMNGTKTLVKGTDYTLSYKNNISAGVATVIITGKGNYSGTLTKNFTITAKSASSLTIPKISGLTYSGISLSPGITIKDGTKTLVKNTDYTTTYSNNKNMGTATVKIVFKGNYTGTVYRYFTISAKPISSLTTTLSATTYVYNGSAKKPTVTVKFGTTTLVNGVDYVVTYSANKNCGKGKVVITGLRNYTGSVTKYIYIKPAKAKGLTTSARTTTAITLKWTKSTGVVTGYEIYQAKGTSTAYSKIATIKGASNITYTKTGLTPGTDYKYKIRAYKVIGGTKYYGTFSAIEISGTRTKAPAISTLTAGSKKVTVKWAKVSGADGYQIYYATSKTGTYKKFGTYSASTTSKAVTSLTAKKTYYFKIRSYITIDGTKYYSSWSAIKSKKTK